MEILRRMHLMGPVAFMNAVKGFEADRSTAESTSF